MTRRVSKHGTTYTEGSSSSFGQFPHICHGCGEKIVLARELGVWFEKLPGLPPRSFHWRCRMKK